MKIAHTSDTHGYFPTISSDVDLIIHSGDFFPDPIYSCSLKDLISFQTNWLFTNLATIRDWTHGKTIIFCQGNHDWPNPKIHESILNSGKINAYVLHESISNIKGLYFYGFPFVPTINDTHNHNKDHPEMNKAVQKLVQASNNKKVDVIIAHCPPAGVLDLAKSGQRFGNLEMSRAFMNDFKVFPKAFLCGHIHYSGGKLAQIGKMIVSNAATTINYIEI